MSKRRERVFELFKDVPQFNVLTLKRTMDYKGLEPLMEGGDYLCG
jgi:hypothetical protein